MLCPRCELNYIKKADQYCNVCKKDLKLIEASEDDIGDLELCPFCKINFVQSDEEACDSCRQELGIDKSEEDDDREVSDWHKYIDDDDSDEDDDDIPNELADDVYDHDELEETAGIVDDFDFGDDSAKEDFSYEDEDVDDDDEDFDIFDDSDDDDDEDDDEDDGDDF